MQSKASSELRMIVARNDALMKELMDKRMPIVDKSPHVLHLFEDIWMIDDNPVSATTKDQYLDYLKQIGTGPLQI